MLSAQFGLLTVRFDTIQRHWYKYIGGTEVRELREQQS
jgi:hypothetical protein